MTTDIQNKLYPYQTEDVQWLIDHPKCINGLKMGWGKTIEALALCDKLDLRHVLIVCKKSLVGEWFYQTDKWLDGDCLTPHENGTYDHKLAGLDLLGPKFVCINYDLLALPLYSNILRQYPWDCIIFDEAHHLKNPKAKRTKEAIRLARGIPRLLFMTGTPLQNNPLDLYPLFNMMNSREYHNQYSWKNWFCVMEEDEIWLKNKYTGKPQLQKVRKIIPGQVENEDLLNKLLHLYMLQREPNEVMPHLPPKRFRRIPIGLGPERVQYRQMLDEYFTILDSGTTITAPKAVAQMTRLRQICLDPNTLLPEAPRPSTPSNKTLTLLDVIDECDGKLVVFTYFERYASILCRVLQEKGIPFATITGQVKKTSERLSAELSFQNDPSIKVLVGTIGAMGEGLTLTAADVVVFTDLFWNPSVNEQCESRVYGRVDKGLDSTKSVLIVDIICDGTVEDYVHEIVRAKESMVEAVVTRKVVDRLKGTRL